MDALAARLLLADDPEQAMREDMAVAIDARRALGHAPGRPDGTLRLLLVGYAGAGNTGADIRIHEIVRQLRAIFGDRVEIGLVTRGAATDLPDCVRMEQFGGYFPTGMAAVIDRYDAVLVCEGSLFTSTFSDTLTTMLAGALGMAAAQGKPAIAYGVEAGTMGAAMTAFVRDHCRGSVVFCRSAASLARVRDLGLDGRAGTDTAWTFDPAPPHRAEAILRARGWNGTDPVLAVCPIDPFWWPVRPDILRALSGGAGGPDHYDSVLFHHRDADSEKRFARYIDAVASAVGAHCAATRSFPIVVGMERLDRAACDALAAALPGAPPVVTSADLEPRDMVALLRRAALVVGSRFHAVLTAMPGGGAVVGVTMDERLLNLFADTALEGAVLRVDDPELASALLAALRSARAVPDEAVGRQLAGLAAMGRALAHELSGIVDARPPSTAAPSAWLPPLSSRLADQLHMAGAASPADAAAA